MPRRIEVVADSTVVLQEVAKQLCIGYAELPLAWSLANFSGSLVEYFNTRNWAPDHDLNWPRSDFDTEVLQFRNRYTSDSNPRLSSYDDPVTTVRRHYFIDGDRRAQMDLDWGRYAVLSAEGKKVLLYDQIHLLLAVPISVPLPRLMARAVALCSGYAPSFVAKSHIPVASQEVRGFDVYTGVPMDVVQAVASKLNQILTFTNLRT